MRDLAELLFGRDGSRLLRQVLGDSSGDREMADRARRSGEWCGSTPGSGSARGQVMCQGGPLKHHPSHWAQR